MIQGSRVEEHKEGLDGSLALRILRGRPRIPVPIRPPVNMSSLEHLGQDAFGLCLLRLHALEIGILLHEAVKQCQLLLKSCSLRLRLGLIVRDLLLRSSSLARHLHPKRGE